MTKVARSMLVGVIALAIFTVVGFAAGYTLGKQITIKTLTPNLSVGPQKQSGLINSFKDSTLEIIDPQTQDVIKFTIDSTAVIRLTDKAGIFQSSDTSALIKNNIALIKNDGGILYIDVIPPVQSQ